LYKHATTDEDCDDYIDHLRRNMGKNSSNLTLSDALFDPKYRKATWVNIGYMFFHEVTGYNIILLYSSSIFAKIKNSHGEHSFKGRLGTEIIGVINVIFAVLALYLVKKVGRRVLLIWGHLGMAVSFGLFAYFSTYNNDKGALAMIMFFLMFYQSSSGPVAWMYAAETTIDAAFGIVLLVLWTTILGIAYAIPLLSSEDSIGVTGVFTLFSVFCAIGGIYSYVFIKETKGLSDKAKKEIFLK
jgi:SP family arabinose:H+ symporter-like MFS transporter